MTIFQLPLDLFRRRFRVVEGGKNEWPEPCHCGEQHPVVDAALVRGATFGPWRIDCPSCERATPYFATREKAIANWNDSTGRGPHP